MGYAAESGFLFLGFLGFAGALGSASFFLRGARGFLGAFGSAGLRVRFFFVGSGSAERVKGSSCSGLGAGAFCVFCAGFGCFLW